MRPMNRVIVIGLDGLEPRLVEPLIQRGELPHLARLRSMGDYARVRTTAPAQTPVAWSTFATGVNPGAHGIFDFLRRNPSTYLPELALNRYEQKNAFVPPRVVNLRRAKAVWQVLSEAGLPSVVLRCPCTYPPDEIKGRVLSGMGVPDLRGSLGMSTFYTSRHNVRQGEGETVVAVQPPNGRPTETQLLGPLNPKSRRPVELPITIRHAGKDKVVVVSDGQPQALEVRQGQWSDWLRVKFKLGMLQSVRGMVRFYLVATEPEFQLYASPVNYDPQRPLFPISSPPEYTGEMSQSLGTFYTAGMPEDHNGLVNERIDEVAFLDQCEQVLRERKKMMLHELNRFEEGLFFCLFDTPDRVHHMFWRFGESDHPANAAHGTGPFEHVIAEHYRQCDAVVGRVLEAADDRTLLVVLSDHGCGSFRRGVHLNTWLHDQGLLALRKGHRPGEEVGDLLRDVDWERTRAYALGLGGIYLNLRGREGKGSVSPGDAEPLKAEIAQRLTGLADPQHGQVAVRRVVRRDEVYRGAFIEEAPDLMVYFAEGYRASWATAMGGVPQGYFEDNTRRWSGDHIVDPDLMPGVLLMNRAFRTDKPRLLDMAPTILGALGVPKPAAMEGEELLL